MRHYIHRLFLLTQLLGIALLLLAGPLCAQQDVLFGLDARFSQIVRVDLASGTEQARYPSPVLCKPEGACGMAYNGHAIYIVDSTDPDRRIYEVGAESGVIWHSFPSPPGSIDGLAYDDGVLYTLDFLSDTIYALDPFDGSVLRELSPGVDIIGGMGVSQGRLYASRIRPSLIFAIDGESGQLLHEWPSPSAVPTGIAAQGSRLFVGDFRSGAIVEMDGQNGAVLDTFARGMGDIAGLAAGRVDGIIPYHLRLERGSEELRADGLVQLEMVAGLYDAQGRLMHTNDHSLLRFVLSGDIERTVVATASGGVARAGFALDPGVKLVVRAELDGLKPVEKELRVVSPTVRTTVEFIENTARPGYIEVKAHMFDATDNRAVEDTSQVHFTLLGGRAMLASAPTVVARNAMASFWLYTDGLNTDITVEVRVRSVVGVATLNTGKWPVSADLSDLTVTNGRTAGRDNIPPTPVEGLRAVLLGEGQWAAKPVVFVELSWQLAQEDGMRYFVPFGEQIIARDGIEGYRLMRSQNGGLYREVAVLPAGTDRFVDLVDPDGNYAYQIIVSDADNWRIAHIEPGSAADEARRVSLSAVGLDAEGNQVRGLFDGDLDVDLDDFFLFADVFGTSSADAGFDSRFDLDGDGAVRLSDFFLFADNFGAVAVRR